MALIGPTEGEVEERRWHQPRHWESLGVTGSHWESLGVTGSHWELGGPPRVCVTPELSDLALWTLVFISLPSKVLAPRGS